MGIGNLTLITQLGVGYNSSLVKSEMEIFEDNSGKYKIANVEFNPGLNGANVVIYDINSSGTLIGAPSIVNVNTSGMPHGIEFSPNGEYLYVTNTVAPYIQYIDISNNSIHTLPQVTNQISFKDSQIELGSDENLYFPASDRLACLSGSDNPLTAIWTNNKLPITIQPVTISGQNIMVLPDQVDGEDYSNVFSSSAQCCDFNNPWDKGSFTAAVGNSTWTSLSNPLNGNGSIAKIQNTLKIPSNANVTIQGMTLEFGLSGKITVEVGGKLTIDNTTLTGNTSCQNMWQGVEVLGSGQTGQPFQAQQGQFISQNNSYVVQAINGIRNGSFVPNNSNYGGYISCTQTNFMNCRYGAVFAFHNLNANYTSEIRSCSFNSTSLWYPCQNSRSIAHVALVDVRGGTVAAPGVDVILPVNFGHSSFNNADYGVTCVDATNINLQFLDFSNCGVGVSNANAFSVSSNGCNFANLVFTSCYSSIELKNTSNDIVSNCVFNTSFGSQSSNFYGIYIDGSSDFHITDNYFNRLKYGVRCNNSGSVGGRISSNNGVGNVFHECWRGIDCRGDNQNLQIKCNQFHNVSQPNSEYSTAWYIGGDLPNQGSGNCPTCPAGNQFFRSGVRKDIYSLPGIASCNLLNFCYFRNFSPAYYIPLVYTPNEVSIQPTNIQGGVAACIGQGLMAQNGNDPEAAIITIEQENDPVNQQLWINELIAWYQEHFMEEDAIAFLENRNDDAAKQMLFPLYLSNNDFSKAQSVLNYYCNQFDDESQSYCGLNSILFDWQKNNLTPFEMSENQKSILIDIANGRTSSTAQAQIIIEKVFGETIEPWEPSDSGSARMIDPSSFLESISGLKIYPNPASNGNILMSGNFDGEGGSLAALRISNLFGNLVFEKQCIIDENNQITIYVSDLENGIYIVEVEGSDGVKQYAKLLIEK